MKSIGNFLVGSLSSLGMAQAIPDTVQTVSGSDPNLINSVEAIVSLVTGLLSALLVSWLKKKLSPKKTKQ